MAGSLRLRRGALAAAIVFVGMGGAYAQTCCPGDDHHVNSLAVASPTGLGEAYPSAVDVSSTTNWHAYVFVRDGIRYVQINDINGVVHMAVGVASGSLFILPVGKDTATVVTAAVSGATQVYSDLGLTISASADAAGVVSWYVLPLAAK